MYRETKLEPIPCCHSQSTGGFIGSSWTPWKTRRGKEGPVRAVLNVSEGKGNYNPVTDKSFIYTKAASVSAD